MKRAKFLITLLIASIACSTTQAGIKLFKKNGQEKESVQSESDAIQQLLPQKSVVRPLGIVVANIHDFAKRDIAIGQGSDRAINDRLQVLAVESDSHGSELGLEVGDVLMEIDGHYVPKGATAEEKLTNSILPKVDWSKPVEAMVLRDGYAMTLRSAAPDSVASANRTAKDKS